jgi:hypothetical protein
MLQGRMLNESHMTEGQRGMVLRVLLSRMRHDGCGGRAGRAELLTGFEGASSRPVRRIIRRFTPETLFCKPRTQPRSRVAGDDQLDRRTRVAGSRELPAPSTFPEPDVAVPTGGELPPRTQCGHTQPLDAKSLDRIASC